MRPDRLLWLLLPLLLGVVAMYLAIFRLLLASTRRRIEAHDDTTAVRHGHLVVLRPGTADLPQPSLGAGPTRLERRRRRSL
jgi:hypothetical protein